MIIQEAHSEDLLLPISHSCLALDVSRSGYYEWLKRSEKIPADNSESSDLIDQISRDSFGISLLRIQEDHSRTP